MPLQEVDADGTSVVSRLARRSRVSALGTFAVATPASAQSLEKNCGTVSGAKFAEPGTTKTGTSYTVLTYKYSCSSAKKLVPALTAQTIARKAGRRDVAPHPPKGTSCFVNPDNNDHAYSGHCSKGTSLFEWKPVGG
jgi:hypothetical protein